MPASKIGWTDDGWNPYTWNCNKVSPGCKNCYAQTHSLQYPQNSGGAQFLGAPILRAKAWEELRLTKPGTVVFVNTHSDTFHEQARIGWIDAIFKHMNQRPDLLFLLLTKRPQVSIIRDGNLRWTDNIWLGTSIETQLYYQPRLEALLNTPAKHKFISFEPLLGPIVPDALLAGVEWMIVGGESGEERRPFGRQWALDLQLFAQQARIPFFFKQGSAVYPGQDRLLGGKTWDERPAAFAAFKAQYEKPVQNSLF